MFKCFKSAFNAYDYIRKFQEDIRELEDKGEYSKVVVHPITRAEQPCTLFWAVEEVHHDYVELLGDFTDIAYACQFADCYTSNDYDWYHDEITWDD